jgi:hypothetical protein
MAERHFEQGPDGRDRFVSGPVWAPRVYEVGTQHRVAALRALHRRFYLMVIVAGGLLGGLVPIVGWSSWLLLAPYALLLAWYQLRLRALTRDLSSSARAPKEQMARAAEALPVWRIALLLVVSILTLAVALWVGSQGAERWLVVAGAALGGIGTVYSALLLRLRARS